jgi:hypothetical protein
MPRDLEPIWKELESRYSGEEGVYRRLDLEHEIGIRMAILSPGRTWAILVEISPDDVRALVPPRWRGMGVKLFPLAGPEPAMKHICLYVEAPEHRPVFTALCSDIVRTLESSESKDRVRNLQQCFHRWSKFFERWGQEGMTQERQRGLFGELEFLELLLGGKLSASDAVSSWKGCSGGVHDFAHGQRAVEVKTTISKEPRKVSISSERQLDNEHLRSLSLFVLTLQETEGEGMSLPDKVMSLRKSIEEDVNAASLFEASLISAGYLDSDADRYPKRYAIRKREAFSVRNEFPRIVSLSPGIGDLQYTVTVSACEPYKTDLRGTLNDLSESAKQ